MVANSSLERIRIAWTNWTRYNDEQQLGHGDLANLKEQRLTAAYKLLAQAKANKFHILNDLVPDTLPRTGKYFIELTNTVIKKKKKSFPIHVPPIFAGYDED